MTAFMNRVFRLRPGETGLVFTLGFLLLSNSMARQISGIVAISNFLDTGGVNAFLLVLGVDYALILLMGGLQSLIVDRVDRVRLMSAMSFIFALVFVILRLLFTFQVPNSLNYAILYVVAEQQFIFFPLFFWVLANDIFDYTQAKRLFPVIAAWSFVGKLLGIGVSYISPTLFETLAIPPEDVLMINVLIYLIAYLAITIGLRKVNLRQTVQKIETVQETLSEGWGFVKEVLSFRFLTISIIALAICDTIIEFRFLVITDAAFQGADTFQRFYSLYRLAATLAAFAMQSFLTSRLIDKINLKNSFLILPLVILAGAGTMIAFPGLITALIAMIVLKLTRETVDESSKKSFQALVPEERRGRVSVFMDSYLPAIGTILGCLIGGAIVVTGIRLQSTDYFYAYLGFVVFAAIVAVWAVFMLRKNYDSSLLNWRLKRRQRASSVLDGIEF